MRQGFLARLRTFDWSQEAASPSTAWLAAGLRAAPRGVLWANAHPLPLLGACAAIWLVSRRTRRRQTR